ncbi:hypothetical protein [Streptomyces sp. TUS-ST3]|uniref:hypothetical protein n=1 Tax=Streptomyces sp. TUS-ST3 TaxID=3025591 RepID=UPI0024E07E56|nr:hypothetical protein [Streptomyces sp. TUS-ST3]
MDEIRDFIGSNWPNADEDDHCEMAAAVRELAEQFADHGAQSVPASSEGAAVDALQEDWDLMRSGHLENVPDMAWRP